LLNKAFIERKTTMTAILGIDVAQATIAIALWRDDQTLVRAEFNNTQAGFNKLHRFLKKRRAVQVHACLEATGRYWEHLAEFLVDQEYQVSVVNPAQIKKYAESQLRRNKTDRLDAEIIADFCVTQHPPLWSPPSPAQRELQTLVRHLADLEDDRQRQRNRLHGLRHAIYSSPTVQDNLQQQIAFLTTQIDQVKQAIQDHIDRHPDLKQQRDLLDSIQGIGPLTAAKLLGEYGDMSQFTDVRQVVAFAGLNPRHRQSGTSVRGHTSISKMGRSSIRAALYMPAVVAKRTNPRLVVFADRLTARGLSQMEIIVAVMRKLLHFAFGVLKSQQPFEPDLDLISPSSA
jgi:transposase